MIVRARAPLRLGLAGGGTDVAPYCDIYGGYVLNATIDRYAYAVIKMLDEPVVRFVATDQQSEEVKALAVPLALKGKLDLHKAVYNHMVQHYNGGAADCSRTKYFLRCASRLWLGVVIHAGCSDDSGVCGVTELAVR